MPFCGEVSCHREDTRHSQSGHGDTKRRSPFLKGSILPPLPLGVDCGCFERIFVARRKVKKKKNTRRERAGGDFMDRVTTVQLMLSSTTPLSAFLGATPLVLDEERNFYAPFYALMFQLSTEQELSRWSFSLRYLRDSRFSPIINSRQNLSCGYLPEGCPLINSQTWRKNCGYWRIWTWCTSVRLHWVYR